MQTKQRAKLKFRAKRLVPIGAALRRFGRQDDGALMIFGLVLFMLMAMMGGLAVDLMRYESVRTTLQNTLDRSTLAAASLNNRLNATAVVYDYFDKAGMRGYLTNVTVTESLNFREVTAAARANTEPMFVHLVGIDTLEAPGHSMAEQRVGAVEVVLALDISGSMSGAKIANLKTAAMEFVDTVLSVGNDEQSSITVVPYNAQVNLGPTLIAQFNATDPHGVADVNCIDMPGSAYAMATLSPTDPLPMTAYADISGSTNRINSYVSPTSASYAVPNFSSSECKPSTVNIVRLPARDNATIKANINGMVAAGRTSIMMGMKWGVTLLDVAARPMFAQFITDGVIPATLVDQPLDAADRSALKVIVLMTDGEHVSHNLITTGYRSGLSPIYLSTGDGNYSVHHTSGRPAAALTNEYWVPHLGTWQASPWNSGAGVVQRDWTAIWANLKLTYVAWQFYGRALGLTSGSPLQTTIYNSTIAAMRVTNGSVSTMDNQLQQTCAFAKASGVIVYGIAFEAPTTGQTQIRNCASSTAHYFNASGLQIQTAFQEIAANISQLRLTQ